MRENLDMGRPDHVQLIFDVIDACVAPGAAGLSHFVETELAISKGLSPHWIHMENEGISEVAISAHDVLGLPRHCTGDELVIVCVPTDRFRKRRRQDELRGGGDQIQCRPRVYARELLRQPVANPDVLLDDLTRDENLDQAVTPSGQYVTGSTAEEHT